MTDTATTDDTTRLAATLEAETLQRAGQYTLTQAKAHIRDRRASPVAHLALQLTERENRLAAALRELHACCVLMNNPDPARWPTDAEFQAAVEDAGRALDRH